MENINVSNHLYVPMITSYPRYAALTAIIGFDHATIPWIIENFTNMYIRKYDDIELFFGYATESYYEQWNHCPFINKLELNVFGDIESKWIKVLEEGKYIYTMLDTEILGVSENKAFYHDVLISGYENDKFLISDFYPPHYTWGQKKIVAVKTVEAFLKCKRRKFEGFWIIEKVKYAYPFCEDWKKTVTNKVLNNNISQILKYVIKDIEKSSAYEYNIATVQFICDYFFVFSNLCKYAFQNCDELIANSKRLYEQSCIVKYCYLRSLLKNDKRGFLKCSEQLDHLHLKYNDYTNEIYKLMEKENE